MKNKKIYYLLTFVMILLFSIFLPFFIDWFIIGNDIPSNISNSEWVSFLGSYIGSIIGFIGIIITIIITCEENQKNREIQIKPVLFVEQYNTIDKENYKYNEQYYITSTNNSKSSIKFNDNVHLVFKNIGLGNAFDINSQVLEHNSSYIKSVDFELGEKTLTNVLLVNENLSLSIFIILSYDEFDNKKDELSMNNKTYDEITIKLKISYRDIFNNLHSILVELSCNVFIKYIPETNTYINHNKFYISKYLIQ